MSESITESQPAVQSNPFAKRLADHVNAGTVAIESERAIAEAQGKLVIAKRFPRDQARAYSSIIDACKRPGLAEEACYSFPRGGQNVSGPSIRLAEMLAANWGNIDYGIRELSRKDGVSEMEAYCWDLETNTMSSQKFTVRHIRDTRGGGVKLTDERDIYELTANMGGRRLRARILAILPADLVQAAVDECSKTLAGGNEIPIGDRVRVMLTAFKAMGVPAALIEKRLGHALDTVTGEELADLRKVHNSIRDGVSKIADWFGDGAKEDEDTQNERPKPPARRGGAAAAMAATETPAADPKPEPKRDAAPTIEAEIVDAAPADDEAAKKAEREATEKALKKREAKLAAAKAEAEAEAEAKAKAEAAKPAAPDLSAVPEVCPGVSITSFKGKSWPCPMNATIKAVTAVTAAKPYLKLTVTTHSPAEAEITVATYEHVAVKDGKAEVTAPFVAVGQIIEFSAEAKLMPSKNPDPANPAKKLPDLTKPPAIMAIGITEAALEV